MEKKDEKRVLRVELSDDVKKISITGVNGEEKVVMRQELNEDELEEATGGGAPQGQQCVRVTADGNCQSVFNVYSCLFKNN